MWPASGRRPRAPRRLLLRGVHRVALQLRVPSLTASGRRGVSWKPPPMQDTIACNSLRAAAGRIRDEQRQHLLGGRSSLAVRDERYESFRLDALSKADMWHAAQLPKARAKEYELLRTQATRDPVFTTAIELDLGTVVPSLAGPKRPQDRIELTKSKDAWRKPVLDEVTEATRGNTVSVTHKGKSFEFGDGNVVIAAITSCTNTSNPSVMVAAGLLARKARALGLQTKPWVKTSLAPGSRVVTDYLERANLMDDLQALGFNTVGYGCTTCIGNSGPLDAPIVEAINRATSSPHRCSRATATSRGGLVRTFGPTIWPRRRWWWRTRSRGTWTGTRTRRRSARIGMGRMCS